MRDSKIKAQEKIKFELSLDYIKKKNPVGNAVDQYNKYEEKYVQGQQAVSDNGMLTEQ